MQKLKSIFTRKSQPKDSPTSHEEAKLQSDLESSPQADTQDAQGAQGEQLLAGHSNATYSDKVIIGDHFLPKGQGNLSQSPTVPATSEERQSFKPATEQQQVLQTRSDSNEIMQEPVAKAKELSQMESRESYGMGTEERGSETGARPKQRSKAHNSSVTNAKVNTSLNQNVMRQINMDIFKNIVQSKRRVILSTTDREQLWLILRDYNRSHRFKDLQKPANHRRLWLKCSGALGQKLSNPGYYDGLKRQGFFYPNPAFIQIELDLTRTYPHVTDEEELKSMLEPLRNVLYAIVIRNPTIGYCQGMNFIAARLLNCMREEEAFWAMSQIVEKYLPLDYYSNMVGVLVDQKVLQHYMRQRFPRLCEHLENHMFSLDLIAFQWIACLFAINLPQHIHFAVWDLFFIKGIVVIFRFALTILALMEEEILQLEKFEDIYFLIEHYCQEKLDIKTLLDKFSDRISMREIEDLRVVKRKEIMEMLKKQMQATQNTQGRMHQFPRLKFISNFQLYHGLSKYYTQMRVRLSEDQKEEAELIQHTLEKFDQDLMSIFDCNPSWPLCLYDFTHKNACPKFVAMRVRQTMDTYVIEDYFFSKDQRIQQQQLRSVCLTNEEQAMQPELPFDQLIIQRDHHVCQDMSNPNFVPYFKKRFQASDIDMYQSQHLHFDIDDQVDAIEKMKNFVASVTKPLSDEIFDAVEKFQRRASMAALKREVDRVTRPKIENDLIIPNDMDAEFDQALLEHHGAAGQAQQQNQGHGNSGEIHDERLSQIMRPPMASKEQPATAQSISNLQIAVRMTLLEQAGLQNQSAVKSNGIDEESKIESHLNEEANPAEEEKRGSSMVFITPMKNDVEYQGSESGEDQSGSKDSSSTGRKPSLASQNDTSFFEDWSAPANIRADEKKRLLQQMSLLRYNTLNIAKHKSGPNEEEEKSESDPEDELEQQDLPEDEEKLRDQLLESSGHQSLSSDEEPEVRREGELEVEDSDEEQFHTPQKINSIQPSN